MLPLVLISGFSAFEHVSTNPSGEVALALAARPPAGLRVRACELPVSFARAPEAWDAAFPPAEHRPDLVLGLGVHREPGFRLESRACARLVDRKRCDVDGAVARFDASGSLPTSDPGPARASSLDLYRLRNRLRRLGADPVSVSDDAGGYVCERIYHHLLSRAHGWACPGLFIHTPHRHFLPVESQVEILGALLGELFQEAG